MNVNAPPQGARFYQAPNMMQRPARATTNPTMGVKMPAQPKPPKLQGTQTAMGFKVTHQHNYLGHFKNPAILAQGHNPLTAKGKKVYENMEREYGAKKGKQVFYASRNAGKIKGVD